MGFRSTLGKLIGGKELIKADDLSVYQSDKLSIAKPSESLPKSLFFDPFSIIDNLGYKERVTPISYNILRTMANRVPACGAIIQLRKDQMARVTKPQTSPQEMGFRVKLRDAKKEPTKQEAKRAQELETFLLHTGARENPKTTDSFTDYIKKIVRDSLILDQACTEIVRDKRGIPCEFYAVDGASIRIADTSRTGLNTDPHEVRYVQTYDSVVVAEFSSQDLIFGVRNPRTDLTIAGYGLSELEIAMNVVTSLLWGFDYNTRFFSQGSVTKGIINFKGAIPENMLTAFRRFWYAQTTGSQNAFKMPVLNADDLQYVDLHKDNREMEFSNWMDFLLKYFCAIYGTDPAEINFIFGNTGQSSSLNQSSNEEKLKQSRDRGLRPLANSIEEWINRHIIWDIDPHFSLEFAGMDAVSAEKDREDQVKRVHNLQYVDEIRAEMDLPPLPDGKGEVILDPIWMQFAQAKDWASQEGEPGPDQGSEQKDGFEQKGSKNSEKEESEPQSNEVEKSEDPIITIEL